MLEYENIKLNIVGGGMGMADTEINGRIIAVRNYGIIFPKGYKLRFVVDGEEVEEVLTASEKFKEITGYDVLQQDDGSTMKSCVDYIIKKYC